MKEDIKRIKGIIVEDDGEEIYYRITGDTDKLKQIRQMLDIAEYNDDTEIACPMFGFMPAKETISMIVVANYIDNKGYMAIA